MATLTRRRRLAFLAPGPRLIHHLRLPMLLSSPPTPPEPPQLPTRAAAPKGKKSTRKK